MMILGVDQGSTKTMAIVVDECGNILGKGLGPGACHFFVGMETAMQAVEFAAKGALTQARLTPAEIKLISAGMAGANWPEEIRALETNLREHFHVDHATVYNDCLIALRAGTENRNCGVICAGTGLNVALRTQAGMTLVYNNYIEDLDQGAGGLGRRTLQAIFLSEIGVLPSTSLTKKVLDYFQLDSVENLLLASQRGQLSKPVNEVSILLFEAEKRADPVARQIVTEFGISISRYIIAGIRKYDLLGVDMDIVLSGGVFKARSKLLFEIIGSEIQVAAPKARVIHALYEPVVGAALLAWDQVYGGAAPEAVLANCRKSVEHFDLMRIKQSILYES